ncbi:NADH-ubiquinone oxidoreductase chain G [hydrothermal vent metagenome]|uniref:NADH-ubiquinone oxidoreductase chain G n=1 Tax=hydrothermal vent metagenome TaxID=652676 RepID=A0A3B1E6S4_9ZZZZ
MSEHIVHRGKTISITIDDKVCSGTFGQTILEIARANNIYIPTMCHLTKVSPITSCRMCVVDIKGVEGSILSCQEKAVDGAVVSTQNDNLFNQRQNIMKMYDVNHPLQCGVCDKSGECDLQNKTLEFKVKSQPFAVKDIKRKKKKWGILGYDPALCIMCERCVSTCNEIIGSAALYIKPGGYKSIIDMKYSRCEQCGDCISVCPVGALVSNEFTYTSNVWESDKIPASCAHCSSGCSLEYNVKSHSSDELYGKKITRVTNDFEFSSLCGAGRFGFEFENKTIKKDIVAFQKAIEAIKNSDAIKFNSYITNEEAMLLQKLKETIGINLINEDAKNYQVFLENYRLTSGKYLFSGTLKTIQNSDVIVMLGTRISRDNPGVKYAVNIANKKQRAQFVYMHPIDDIALQNKYTQFIKYEASSEEGVVALLASYLIKDMPEEYKEYFDDLDIGYLSGESSIGEEELDLLVKNCNKKNKTLIIGEDLYGHPQAPNIAKMVGLIDKYTDFNVVILPSATNTLGVSLICNLDEEIGSKVVGYNEMGDFIISDTKNGNLQIPALNQQEGTFVNVDKKVINTNVALDFNGYCLNDIVNEFLNIKMKNTIDYTKKLPISKGFKSIDFDELQNGYNNTGVDLRGYTLDEVKIKKIGKIKIDNVSPIDTYNGTVIYRCEPLHHFNKNTAKSLQLQSNNGLRGSSSFAAAAKIKDGDTINITYNEKTMTKKFKLDSTIKGTIALYPTYDDGINDDQVPSGYRFKQVKIERQ